MRKPTLQEKRLISKGFSLARKKAVIMLLGEALAADCAAVEGDTVLFDRYSQAGDKFRDIAMRIAYMEP